MEVPQQGQVDTHLKLVVELLPFAFPKIFPLGKQTSAGAGNLQNLHGLSSPFTPQKKTTGQRQSSWLAGLNRAGVG